MTGNRTHSGNQPESAEQTFGQSVYDLLIARYGHPVLSSDQNIQQLKSADRRATVTLLFGADAALSERFQQIDAKDLVKEIADRVENMQTIMKVQGDTEKKTNVLSGLLETIGHALSSLG